MVKHLLLMLFFPSFVFIMKERESNKLNQRMLESWNQCTDYLGQLLNLKFADESYLAIMDCTVEHCQSALFYCNAILDQLGSAQLQEEKWRQEIRLFCEENKKIFEKRLNELLRLRDDAYCFKSIILYQRSLRITAAAEKYAGCYRSPDHVEEVVFSLEQASILYNQAADLVEQALEWTIGSSRDDDRALFINAIAYNKEAARLSWEEAMSWKARAA